MHLSPPRPTPKIIIQGWQPKQHSALFKEANQQSCSRGCWSLRPPATREGGVGCAWHVAAGILGSRHCECFGGWDVTSIRRCAVSAGTKRGTSLLKIAFCKRGEERSLEGDNQGRPYSVLSTAADEKEGPDSLPSLSPRQPPANCSRWAFRLNSEPTARQPETGSQARVA